MKRGVFLVPAALFVVLVIFLGKGLTMNPSEVPSPLLGKRVPTFALTRLDDPATTVHSQGMAGKVWVLNVWASWCAPCRQEHPLWVDFAKHSEVAIVGLNYKDQRGAALDWLQRWGNPYTASLSDVQGDVGIDFGVYGVPETFVIDKAGVIRHKHIGPITPQVLNERIMPLLERLNGQ